MADIIDIVLSIARAFFGFFLILFMPGYAVIWALFPDKSDFTGIERIAFSFVTSIGLTIVSVLFLDLVIGVDTTPLNLTLALILVTLFCASAGILSQIIEPRAKIAHITTLVIDRVKIFILKRRQRGKTFIWR